MTDAMAPPAERPVTKMRLRSMPKSATAFAIIWRMDSASPRSRARCRLQKPGEAVLRLFPGEAQEDDTKQGDGQIGPARSLV